MAENKWEKITGVRNHPAYRVITYNL